MTNKDSKQPEPWKYKLSVACRSCGHSEAYDMEINPPAQPEQEPWGACLSGRVFVGKLPEHVRKLAEDNGLTIKWLYTTPAQLKEPEQEPAFHGFMDEKQCCVNICYTPWAAGGPNNELPTAYYTTPPQRKPLTLVELSRIFASIPSIPFDGEWQLELVRAIEAAHGIKE